MPAPYKTKFLLPDGREITTVVLDEDEFDRLADSLKGIAVLNLDERAAQAQIDSIKAARIIPMMSRGTKTQVVFEQYDIDTNIASFIVRGTGKMLVQGAINEQEHRQEDSGLDPNRN